MTTSVRFAGLLPFWLGACLAVVAAVVIWWYYRRESELLVGKLQWLLPALRTLAFLLGVLVLTGPVLKHRQVIGELGRVILYFDGSDSMTMQDGHMLTGRKLLIASQLGWLSEQRLDTSPLHAADQLRKAAQSGLDHLHATGTEGEPGNVTAGNPEVPGAEQLESARRGLLEEVTGLSGQLEAVRVPHRTGDAGNPALVAVADLLSRDATDPLKQLSVSDTSESRAAAAAALQSIASSCDNIATQLIMQFEAEAESLLSAQDSIVQTAVNQFDAAPRWQRCELEMFDSSQGLYDQLCRYHDVQLVRLAGSEAVLLDPVDPSTSRVSAASRVFAEPFPTSTDLSSGVLATQRGIVLANRDDTDAEPGAESSQTARTAVVLLTDGQHNAGPSPLQVARQLGGQGVPVYCVSLGASQSAPDLAVLALEHPPTVYRKDRVRGVMVVRDRMPPGQSFVAQIRYQSEVVWQQQLLTTNQPERRIEFEFAVDQLVDQLDTPLNSDVVQNSLSFAFEASVSALATESETRNNQQTMWLAVTRQRSRVLILDGRARWETRYVRNAFERDDKWEVNSVIAGAGAQPTLPRGSQDGMFPDSREKLFDYDLIVLGELAPQLLSGSEQLWLKEFVEMRGGGLILIDGLRGQLRQWTGLPASSLLPVAWTGEPLPTEVSSLKLTSQGAATSALKLQMDQVQNNRFWTQLPAPQAMVAVEALPGCEVLVEADVAGTPYPAIVTRQTGAGRVLYLAFDETWRWRYKAADTWHQRIWNQLARFVMPQPFAVRGDYLALDTGSASYGSGEPVPVRIRLLAEDGQPNSAAVVDALVWKEGRVVSTISLKPDEDVPGIYRGQITGLADGNYEVSIQASGYGESALAARSSFVVQPPATKERDETAANEPLLRQMAGQSGGAFLREEDLARLPELLRPLSSGRVVESETLLWQSYWWFAAIVLLLTGEWILRKRAGLL